MFQHLEDVHRYDLEALAAPADSLNEQRATIAMRGALAHAEALSAQILNGPVGSTADLAAMAVCGFRAAERIALNEGGDQNATSVMKAFATMAVWAAHTAGTPLTRFADADTVRTRTCAGGPLNMAQLLDKTVVEGLESPESGNRVTYDTEVKGFGVRVTSAGAKAFILNYRSGGRERRITIGSYPDWKVGAARDHAKALKRRIDLGEDPMGDRHAERAAPTMDELADRFETEHLAKRREATQTDYKSILRLYVRPQMGKTKVADVRHADVEKLHARIAKSAPYRANRTVAVLSKMFSLAVKWEMRTDNPARGIERASEQKRERFLTPAEIARLSEALGAVREKASANAIRLLLLTGARKSELLGARWGEIDLAAGVWTKPSAHTKQKKGHRIPLSAPALLLLTEMRAAADKAAPKGTQPEFLFPSEEAGKPLGDIKKTWAVVCEKAGLGRSVPKANPAGNPILDEAGAPVMVWQHDARLHDLRHTYASILASHGLSLPIIGQLLGHTQAQTTARYAHLLDDPLRAATERVGAVVTGG